MAALLVAAAMVLSGCWALATRLPTTYGDEAHRVILRRDVSNHFVNTCFAKTWKGSDNSYAWSLCVLYHVRIYCHRFPLPGISGPECDTITQPGEWHDAYWSSIVPVWGDPANKCMGWSTTNTNPWDWNVYGGPGRQSCPGE